MKLARWWADGKEAYGLIVGDMAHQVSDDFQARFPDLHDVLAAEALTALHQDAMARPPLALADITWRLPIRPAARMICVGINYPKRYPLD